MLNFSRGEFTRLRAIAGLALLVLSPLMECIPGLGKCRWIMIVLYLKVGLRACLDVTVPFRSPISYKSSFSFRFKTERSFFTTETVA